MSAPALRTFTPRVFVLVTLAAAIALGALVAVPQWLSKQTRLEVLRAHVAQLAQLAAAVVDGDAHRELLDPGRYTPALYDRVVEPLARFHAASPGIIHAYTLVERAGRPYFVVDTTASRALATRRAPSYLEEFRLVDEERDARWLERIAHGETWVAPGFRQHEYGHLLAAYTPIYDSEGRYSGFVGVDYDVQAYLAQEAEFRVLFTGTLSAAMMVAILIGWLAARRPVHPQQGASTASH